MLKKRLTFIAVLLLTIVLLMPVTGCKDKKKDTEPETKEPTEPPVSFSMTVSKNKDDAIDVEVLHFDTKDKKHKVVSQQSDWQTSPTMVYSPERKETYVTISDGNKGIEVVKNAGDDEKENSQPSRICQGMSIRYIFPVGNQLYLVGSKDQMHDKPWIYDLKEDSLKAISWPDDLSASAASYSAIDGIFYIAGYSVDEQMKADMEHPNPMDEPYAVDNHVYIYTGTEIEELFTEKGRNIDELVGNKNEIIYATSLIGMPDNDKKEIKIYDKESKETKKISDDARRLIDGQIIHLSQSGDLVYVNEFTKFSCIDLKAKTTEDLFSVKENEYINSVQPCANIKKD